MFTQELAHKPYVLCRWPARAEAPQDIAAKVFQTLSAVAASFQSDSLIWSADVGDEIQFTMSPFPTDIDPAHVDLTRFAKTDDAGRVWEKGGLAIQLYGRISTWTEGDMVAVTGTVGATTRRGNSLRVDFLTDDNETIPPLKQISTLVETLGEVWDADWCAALTDEIIDAVERPLGDPEVGLLTYWSDSLGRELPALGEVTLRKTAKGCLAEVSPLGSAAAIDYARKVQKVTR